MKKTKVILKSCSSCGEGPVAMVARPGRKEAYGRLVLPVPESLELPECVSCGDLYLNKEAASHLDDALKVAYRDELHRKVADLLSKITPSVSQRRLERLLGLSTGYLSKIRTTSVPSEQLVGELALMVSDPVGRAAELESFWAQAG